MYIPTDPSPTPLQSPTPPIKSSGIIIHCTIYMTCIYIATARAVDETEVYMNLGILQKVIASLYH